LKDSRDGIEEVIRSASRVAGYLKGTLTDEEKTALLAWLEHEGNWEAFARIANEQHLTDAHTVFRRFDTERALANVKAARRGGQTLFRRIRRHWIAVAASMLFVCAVILYISHGWLRPVTDPAGRQALHDIMPGKQGATLTLANGETIHLNDVGAGEIVRDKGMTIRKTADGNLIYTVSGEATDNTDATRVNALSTAKGETYRVMLPDGSAIDLNAASRLTYPSAFTNGGERKVTLVGEGYFRVANDSKRPFIVETAGQQVLVLGTEFNMKAYPDEEKIITTLVDGSLKVTADGVNEIVLTPGEATVFNGTNLTKETADTAAAVAWRQGRFHFNKTPFDSMIRELARWYNVDVEYTGNTVPGIRFSGEMRRDVSLKTVLSYLDELGVNFRLEERKLVIE